MACNKNRFQPGERVRVRDDVPRDIVTVAAGQVYTVMRYVPRPNNLRTNVYGLGFYEVAERFTGIWENFLERA